jgi:hypothetical protein
MEALSRIMQLLDKKLEQSIKDQREFSQVQSQMNRYFLNQIRNGKSGSKHGKSAAGNSMSTAKVNRLAARLSKKKIELLEIKALHRKITGEFIDLWVETRRSNEKR